MPTTTHPDRQPTKPRPHVGDTAWFVEWCSVLAFDECGDVDRDNCTMTTRRVKTREEAEKLAREVYPIAATTFGLVEFWPAEFRAYDLDDAEWYPTVGYWEATADAECYDGED